MNTSTFFSIFLLVSANIGLSPAKCIILIEESFLKTFLCVDVIKLSGQHNLIVSYSNTMYKVDML